jgi:hypothetical protein
MFVVSLNGSDIDIHLLSAPDGASCIERNDTQIIRTNLAAGTWWLSLDTFVSSGTAKSGEFLLGVMTDP